MTAMVFQHACGDGQAQPAAGAAAGLHGSWRFAVFQYAFRYAVLCCRRAHAGADFSQLSANPAADDLYQSGSMAIGGRQNPARQNIGALWIWADCKSCCSLCQSDGAQGAVVGLRGGRARAAAAGETVAVSREAFFKEADIVSLHVRLKPETRGLITAEDLAQMQPRALFVNTSRSGLVAPGALEAEIAKGQLHAAVDVFDHEPLLDRENILFTHPNVLATPHIGFMTEDEFKMQFSDIFDQINAYAAGVPTHMINPEAYQ